MKPAAPPDPGSRSDRDAVRQRVLAHSQTRFFTCGFNSIRMDDIATELGMSKKTLYQLFPSKKVLLETIMTARMHEIGHGLERICSDQSLDFASRLRSMIVFMAENLSQVKQPFLHDVQRYAPDVFDRVETFRQQLIPAQFGRLLDEGRRAGMVRDNLDPRVVIQLIMTSIRQIVNPENLTRLSLSPGQAFETIFSVVFEGVMTPAGRAKYFRQSRESK
jgi:AcrR family transcriptional regulator